MDSTLLADLRYALRGLRRSPAFTAVTVLSLGVGIGAVTAAFAVLDAVEFRPLPYADPERLVVVGEARRSSGGECRTCAMTGDAVHLWRREAAAFQATAALQSSGARWYTEDRAERILTGDVSASFFRVLGVRPMLGRTFTDAEASSTPARVVVLGHDFWRTRLGGDPAVIGTELELSATHGRGRYTVIGVMPREFRFLDNKAWFPLAEPAIGNSERRYIFLARLAPDRSVAAAGLESRQLHSRLVLASPEQHGDWMTTVLPLRQWILRTRPAAGQGRLLLLGVTAFVLLIAVVNVATLSLARSRTRLFEACLRSALGATRGRLVRQFVTETLAIAFLGAFVALAVAAVGIAAAQRTLELGDAGFAVQLDGRVLSFAMLATGLAGIGAGIVPAWYAAQSRFATILGQESKRHTGAGMRAQAAMVTLQIACSLVLLSGGGLLVRELLRLQRDSGFHSDGLFLVTASKPELSDARGRREHAGLVRADLIRIPGVTQVGLTGQPASRLTFRLEWAADPIAAEHAPAVMLADSSFFAVTSIGALRGRLFGSSDRFGSASVAIVNEAAAERFWQGLDVVGKRVLMGDSVPELVQIVGVVRNAKVFNAPLEDDAPPIVYRPFEQLSTSYPIFVVRSTAGAGQMIPLLRRSVARFMSEVPGPGQVVSIEAMHRDELASERLYTLGLATFAVLGLFLAAVGIFGIVSYAASLRRHEFSIRMAVGATPRHVMASVIRSGLTVAAIGIGSGLTASLLLMKVLRALIVGPNTVDARVLATSVLLVGLVVMFAIYLPARRASRGDPALALRG